MGQVIYLCDRREAAQNPVAEAAVAAGAAAQQAAVIFGGGQIAAAHTAFRRMVLLGDIIAASRQMVANLESHPDWHG